MTSLPSVAPKLLAQDFFFGLLVVIQLWLFKAGIELLWLRFNKASLPKLAPVSFASAALVVLCGTFALLAQFGLPSVWVLSGGMLLLQGVGAFRLWSLRKGARNFFAIDKPFKIAFVTFTFVVGIFWVHILRDLPALPSHHDGAAHIAFFLQMLSSGTPLLTLTENAFAKEFGSSTMAFYPSGVHFIVAAFEGLFVKMGVMTAAQALKGWLLVLCAAFGPFAFWACKRLFPERPLWSHLVVALLAATSFRFPVWGIDSGGFSRVGAQVLILPLVIGILDGDILASRSWARRLLLTFGFLGAFLMHPTALGFFSLTVAFGILVSFYMKRAESKERIFKEILDLAIPTALGLAFLLFILYNSNSFSTIDQGNLNYRNLPFNAENFFGRFIEVFTTINQDFAYKAYFPVNTAKILGWLGVAALFFPRLMTSDRPKFRAFVLWIVAVFLVISILIFSPVRPLFLIGELYYNKLSRLVESGSIGTLLLWGLGMGALLKGMRVVKGVSLHPLWKVLCMTASVSLAAFFIFDVRSMARNNKSHLFHYFEYYGSPLRSTSENLANFIREKTPKDSVLLYPAFLGDSLESRTGRSGFFMYLECPVFDYHTENCTKRLEFYHAFDIEMREVIAHPTPLTPCLKALSIFHRPTFVLRNDGRFVHQLMLGSPKDLCSNVKVIGVENGVAILGYSDPAEAPSLH